LRIEKKRSRDRKVLVGDEIPLQLERGGDELHDSMPNTTAGSDSAWQRGEETMSRFDWEKGIRYDNQLPRDSGNSLRTGSIWQSGERGSLEIRRGDEERRRNLVRKGGKDSF